MAKKLEGKVAVVTGAGAGGIGEAVALAMATEGAKVVVNDVSRDPRGTSIADKVVEEISKTKGHAVANYDSVTTVLGGQNIIKTAISNFGRIDILVNCAGNQVIAPIVKITEGQWDSVLNVHVKGHFSCCKAAASEMIKQKSGRIINISSRASFFSGNVSYATAKAAVLGLTTALSMELKEHGITVNAICPGAITKLFPHVTPGGAISGGGGRGPILQSSGPEFVAPMIVYLATDAAKVITGRFFYVTGGDICIYARPLGVPGGSHTWLRKAGKWTIDELSELIPPMLGNG